MGLKKFLLKIYDWPILPPERVNYYQEKIRRAEWEELKPYIKSGSKFLDVGCGAGYNLKMAKEELRCDVRGTDPQPGAHGVGRLSFQHEELLLIDTGVSEHLPYPDESYDIVFSSHVLEHVNDIPQSLSEMKRVLKPDGTLIIGMPTSTMSWIGLFSELLFTTHIRWLNFLMHRFFNTPKTKLKFLFLPASHSEANKTVLYDIKNYRVKKWMQHISSQFVIQKTLLPALYPYPDYRQLFRLRKLKRLGSSVFFICLKSE